MRDEDAKECPCSIGSKQSIHHRINGVWGKIRPIDRPSRLEGFTDVRATPLGEALHYSKYR